MELAHLPRTWPEAKLIAPVLLPAARFTDQQSVGGGEPGMRAYDFFRHGGKLRSVNEPARPD
jgi:hypothetical protein